MIIDATSFRNSFILVLVLSWVPLAVSQMAPIDAAPPSFSSPYDNWENPGEDEGPMARNGPPPPPPQSSIADRETPVVTAVIPGDGPTDGGTILTIVGNNFGSHTGALQVKIGTEDCRNIVLTKSTEILCETPPGVGSNNAVSITVVNQGVSHTSPPSPQAQFQYDAPAVNAVEPGNGPTMGETVITIVGTNFGTSDTKPLAKIGGKRCLDTIWLSNTKLTCITPKGMGIGDVRVFVEGQGSPEGFGTIYEFDPPRVTAIVPAHGPTSGHISITAYGKNFGPTDSHPQGTLGDTPCDDTTWLSDSSVSCDVSSGMGGNKDLILMVLGERSKPSPATKFTYDGPLVSSVSAANGPTAGHTDITIYGMNFGRDDAQPIGLVGGELCVTTHWSSDSSVRCSIPPGVGTDKAVSVRLPGAATDNADLPIKFSYDAPAIASIVPDVGPAKGSFSVTIVGQNFGTQMGAITAYIGESMCEQTLWVANNKATCIVPPGVGTEIKARVVVAGQQSRSSQNPSASMFSYAAPIVTDLQPSAGGPIGGQVITIHGQNFGNQKKKVSALFGDVSCQVLRVSDSRIVVAAPEQKGTQQLSLVVGGQTSEDHPFYAFTGPRIYSISATHGPTVGGQRLVITGSEFGLTPQGLRIEIGGLQCLDSEWVSMTSVICVTPPGVGAAKAIAILKHNQKIVQTSGKGGFSYDAPEILSVTPSHGEAGGGTKIVIVGKNFGFVDSDPRIEVGGHRCHDAKWTSDAGAVCIVPPGNPGKIVEVSVSVAGQTGAYPNGKYEYNANAHLGEILSISPSHAPPDGAVLAEITGKGFERPEDRDDSAITVNIGDVPCDATSWISTTAVTCVIPQGVGADKSIQIQINANTITAADVYFSYDAPIIQSIEPQRGPMEGGVVVTIIGSYFGPKGSHVVAAVGATDCTDTVWISETKVACVAPAGSGNNRPVTVRVGEQPNGPANEALYSFEGLTIDGVAPAHAPAAGMTEITFFGSFGVAGSSRWSPGTNAKAFIGSTQCVDTEWLPEQVTCRVAAGLGCDLTVQVEINGDLWRGFGLFSYDRPEVEQVLPSHGALFGGETLTIQGTNFGSQDNGNQHAFVGGIECKETIYDSNTQLLCVAPAYNGSHPVLVQVLAGGQMTRRQRAAAFQYDPPVVAHVYPVTGPPRGGTELTIEGEDFGSSDMHHLVAYVGPTKCSTTSWISESSVLCLTPKGYSLDIPQPVTVEVMSMPSKTVESVNFTYVDTGDMDHNEIDVFGPRDIPTAQHKGTLYMTIAYLVVFVFAIGSLVLGKCFFSSSEQNPSYRGVRGNTGFMGKIRNMINRTIAKAKALIFKSSGVDFTDGYPGDRWGDYNVVTAIEMEASSDIDTLSQI